MKAPHVSFVIATYKRVDALRCTLRSLILQAHSNWTAIVIGDCCGNETAQAIRDLREPRIRYYNLPRRFGEQSGPNTAGLHLAEGDFVSFLNHDDLLLQDHLDHALDRLTADAGDFFVGKFANATELTNGGRGADVPVFTELLPESEDLRTLAMPDPWCFDPSSFWVVRTSYARAVGAWHPARRLWRTPLRDWVMRAWRLGGIFCFGRTVTGLRFWTQNLRRGVPLYANSTPEHDYMITRMEQESPTATRLFISRQIEAAMAPVPGQSHGGVESTWWRWQAAKAQRAALSGLYLKLGVDGVSLMSRLRGHPAGTLLEGLARKRTGEGLPVQPIVQDFLRDPEAHRIL